MAAFLADSRKGTLERYMLTPWRNAEEAMRKTMTMLGVMAAMGTLAVAVERDAAACGGCFVPQPPPGEVESVITDHRMVLSVSPIQTTLYDEIRYQGSPSSFAWVLPISGTATIGLSSDTLFSTLDQVTGTVVQAPPLNCPAPPSSCAAFNSGGGTAGDVPAPSEAADAGVTVTHQETVGPYETVQLHSTDPTALNAWLTSHGYVIPSEIQPIIGAYVTAQFDFLALKLVPGAGVQAMRPVRVTTAGASPVLPLRMVAAGTGANVGITLWVMADGRYEPQNFPWFHVKDSDLVWDWATSSSNYRDLRAQNETGLGGKGWEVESSTTQSQTTLRQYVANFGRTLGPDAGQDYLPIPAPDGGGIAETSDEVRQDDLNALFAGIGASDGQVRVTRLRADLAHAALTDDLVLTASADQSVASNVHQVTHEKGDPQCPIYNNQCQQIGTAPRSQLLASGGKGSFACAAAPESASSALLGLGIAGVFGAMAYGVRRRRRN